MKYPIFNLLNNRLSTLIYFLTQRCNAKCRMCYNYKNLNKNVAQELNVQEIKAICSNLKRLSLLQCSGGEPFLKEDLFEILSTFAPICSAINLPTNGFLPERIERVVSGLVSKNKNTLVRVAISIDGLGDLHDKIRNYEGAFDRAMDTFHRLKSIQANNRNLLLSCNTVLTTMNEHAVRNIVDYFYSLGIDSHTITYMWGNPENVDSLTAPIESYKQAFKYMHSKDYLYGKFNLSNKAIQTINKLSDLTMINILEKKKMHCRCKAIKKFVVMLENGDIIPCHPIREKLGSVREDGYDILSIVRNNKAKELSKDIHDKRCWCTAQCLNRNNIIYNAKTIFYLARYFRQLI